MEAGATGGPAAFVPTPADLDLPCASALWPDTGLDARKTGAILMFSGVSLGLVGLMLTVMGWLAYHSAPSLEWPMLLGPILLAVGGTFLFLSVCEFGAFPCRLRRPTGDEAVVAAAAGGRRGSELGHRAPATMTDHSFVFNGARHPFAFHCGAVVMQQHAPPPPPPPPPPYDSLDRQQRRQQQRQHPAGDDGRAGDPAPGLPPRLYPLYPGQDPALAAEEDGLPLGHSHALTSQTRNRAQGPQGQRGEEKDDGHSPTCPPPPAYRDVCGAAPTPGPRS